MAATSLAINSFPNLNRPHNTPLTSPLIRIPRPRNPSRPISCSATGSISFVPTIWLSFSIIVKIRFSHQSAMAAAYLASSGHPSFPNLNRPHSTPLIRIRNPSRLISCSATGSISFGWRYQFLQLQADSRSKTLIKSSGQAPQESIKYEYLPTPQIGKKKLLHADQHPPDIIFCTTAKHDDEVDEAILHFSTFDSNMALLKQFSKPLMAHQPYVWSSCRNLILFKDQDNFLCNIATQELITLPSIPGKNYCEDVANFGYVPSTKEFKVLSFDPKMLPFDLFLSGNDFKILTLGTHQWRDVGPPPFDILKLCGGVFINGAIHLRSRRGNNRIAVFNLEREEWGSIAPPPVEPVRSRRCMMELSGYLSMVDKGAYSLDIWLLKDYQNGMWVKECTFSYSALISDRLTSATPLAIEDDGRILVQVNCYSLQIYDPKTKTSREIHRFERLLSNRKFFIQINSSLGHRRDWSYDGNQKLWLPYLA